MCAPKYIYVHHVCVDACRSQKRRHEISWNYNYRQLWATWYWCWWIEPQSSAIIISILNLWAISSVSGPGIVVLISLIPVQAGGGGRVLLVECPASGTRALPSMAETSVPPQAVVEDGTLPSGQDPVFTVFHHENIGSVSRGGNCCVISLLCKQSRIEIS